MASSSRDRRTKAEILEENKKLKTDVQKWETLSEKATTVINTLEQDAQMWKLDAEEWRQGAFNAREELHETRSRLKKVEQELDDRKRRDRSPRRLSTATTRRSVEQTCKFSALNHVLAWERDSVIDEQKEIISKLREENQSLRRGDGPIGEVLCHNWIAILPNLDEDTKKRLLAQKTPVNKILAAVDKLHSASNDMIRWGGLSFSPTVGDLPVANRVD